MKSTYKAQANNMFNEFELKQEKRVLRKAEKNFRMARKNKHSVWQSVEA